jgi:hypothetical protein
VPFLQLIEATSWIVLIGSANHAETLSDAVVIRPVLSNQVLDRKLKLPSIALNDVTSPKLL